MNDKNNDITAAPKKKGTATTLKSAWAPSAAVSDALNAIALIDHFDKKGIAQVVKAAIDLRVDAKSTRDLTSVGSDSVGSVE